MDLSILISNKDYCSRLYTVQSSQLLNLHIRSIFTIGILMINKWKSNDIDPLAHLWYSGIEIPTHHTPTMVLNGSKTDKGNHAICCFKAI